MNYKPLCEKIYKIWKDEKDAFWEFNKFQTEYMPETYYTVCKGAKKLYVLNNNPGIGLNCQTKKKILQEFGDKTYSQISEDFYLYILQSKEMNESAKSRLCKMIRFAQRLGYSGVEDVETFFLHSKNFNKKSFLKKKDTFPYVSEYITALTEYLKDKPVLSINAIDSRCSISKQTIIKSNWINHVAEIIGFDFNKAKNVKITNKETKVTSAAFVDGNKIMLFTMGRNNIPNISENDLEKIKTLLI